MDSDDAIFLERWIYHRDASAFNELVRRYASLVYNAGRRVLGNPAEAEDVAQECFLALARSEQPPAAYLGPWLHRVATNIAIGRLRASARRQAREHAYTGTIPPSTEPGWDDMRACVDEAIAVLPETMRAPLVAHFLEGQSQADIARVLGIPRQTLTNRIHRGVEEVRAHLRRKGIVAGSAGLGALLSTSAAEAAPLPPSLISDLGKVDLSGMRSAQDAAQTTGLAAGTKWIAACALITLVAALAYLCVHGNTLPSFAHAVHAANLEPQDQEVVVDTEEMQRAIMADASPPLLNLPEAPTEIIVGHIESYSGRQTAAALFNEIEQVLPGVKITYDNSLKGKPAVPDRLLYEERLADLIYVYAGPASVLNEVTGLARAGRIRPLDEIPAIRERLALEDFYENVLEPVRFDGNLWALPVRMVVPVLLDLGEPNLDSTTWDSVIASAEAASFGSGGEQYGDQRALYEDFYLLWRTLIQQSGLKLVEGRTYRLDDPRCEEAFGAVARLFARPAEQADIWLASSDALTDLPNALDSLMHTLPRAQNSDVYCAAWTWYVAVRSDVSDAQVEAIARFLEILLSYEVQVRVMNLSFSVPVRPSIVQRATREMPDYGPLLSMAERLRFRQPGKFSEQAETVLLKAFQDALHTPEAYQKLIAEASGAIKSLGDVADNP